MSSERMNPVSRLKTLLGPPPVHPWAGLIPQVLLWSFRRFCVEKLLSNDDTPLLEQLWSDHLDLIRNYAPKGLETITASWMTPENLGHLHSSLDTYNDFFVDFVAEIDHAVQEEDDVLQGIVSEFLDLQIRRVFFEWLQGPQADFLIYPMREEQEAEFTDIQFMTLIHNLLNYTKRKPPVTVLAAAAVGEVVPAPAPAPQPPAPAPPALGPTGPRSKKDPPVEIPLPATLPPTSPPQEEEDGFEDVPAAPAPAPPSPASPPPASTSIAAAMAHRRKTLRRYGPRANRGKTLRSGRIRQKTRKQDRTSL
jgi:hypothetical protein